MGLVELQSALARLYTSATAREQLRGDGRQFAEHCHLSETEVEALAGSVLGEAEHFASALARKRSSEALKTIPAMQETFGKRLDDWFSTYAAATPLGTERNPALDALGFIRWLLQNRRSVLSPREADGLRYEEVRIVMQQTARRFLVRWLRVPNKNAASRSLVVWWRWSGRLRLWIGG
jgi:hypothetical protein